MFLYACLLAGVLEVCACRGCLAHCHFVTINRRLPLRLTNITKKWDYTTNKIVLALLGDKIMYICHVFFRPDDFYAASSSTDNFTTIFQGLPYADNHTEWGHASNAGKRNHGTSIFGLVDNAPCSASRSAAFNGSTV